MTQDSSANREPLRRIPTSQAPPAAAADIGSTLKSARQAKGRTLEVVRQETRIPKKFLEALEENRLDEFPALVYLRGFLKGYCDYLELDFEPIWRSLQPPDPPPPSDSPAAPDDARDHAAARGSAATEAPKRAASGVAATLVSLALAIGLALWLRGGGAAPRGDAPPAPAPAALQPLAAPEGLQLSISFGDEAWIGVKADGKPVFAGLVPKGARQDWKARHALSLRAPDPAGLTLSLNGAPYKLPAADAEGEFKIELP